jgi:two-component system phosphate regulon sensor histidine kinase PhoR
VCNLNDIAVKAASGFRYSLDAQGFRFTYEPSEDIPEIFADREAVTDAVVNLIDNAMKYSKDRKEIFLRTGITRDFVWIEVEDHGIGISSENQKYIFDKFFRVTEKDLANKVKGSGLGLAIVKHIMDAHRGQVSVKSTPGTGSAFRLLFPIQKKQLT